MATPGHWDFKIMKCLKYVLPNHLHLQNEQTSKLILVILIFSYLIEVKRYARFFQISIEGSYTWTTGYDIYSVDIPHISATFFFFFF